MILLNGWILPTGGVALGRVCPAACAAGFFSDVFPQSTQVNLLPDLKQRADEAGLASLEEEMGRMISFHGEVRRRKLALINKAQVSGVCFSFP